MHVATTTGYLSVAESHSDLAWFILIQTIYTPIIMIIISVATGAWMHADVYIDVQNSTHHPSQCS